MNINLKQLIGEGNKLVNNTRNSNIANTAQGHMRAKTTSDFE